MDTASPSGGEDSRFDPGIGLIFFFIYPCKSMHYIQHSTLLKKDKKRIWEYSRFFILKRNMATYS